MAGVSTQTFATELATPSAGGKATHTHRNPTAWSLELLQSMEARSFQRLCQALFGELYLEARLPAEYAKRSLDMELYDKDTPWKLIAIAQCKVWSDPVKVSHIQALHRVMLAKKAAKAYFITSGTFTGSARKHARSCRLTLIDGQRLLQLMKALSPETSAYLLTLVTCGDFTDSGSAEQGIKQASHKTPNTIYQVWGAKNELRCMPQEGAEIVAETE